MAKQSLLVADADPRSLRILDVALRKAGFAVATAADFAEVQRSLEKAQPDLVLCELALPGKDGAALCRALRGDARTADVPVLLMSVDRAPATRMRALEAGADDFLDKPLLLKELLARVRMLLLRRERQRFAQKGGGLTGTVGELGLVDLFQSLEGWRRSAMIFCEWDARSATVWVREGQVIDAESGPLLGEAAFYRLLHWEGGTFRVEFGAIEREPRIDLGTQGLLLEAMRRVDEVARAFEQLPAATVLRLDFNALARRLADLPDEVNGVLRLVDGRRTVAQVLESSPLDDLSSLAVVQRLLGEAVLLRGALPEKAAPRSKPSLRQWLGEASEPPPPRAMPPPPPPEGAEGDEPSAHADSLIARLPPELEAEPDMTLARAFAGLPPPPAAPAPLEPHVAAAVDQVHATLAHADAQQVFEARAEPLPGGLHGATSGFRLPAKPKEAVPVVRFPPLRGVRRERLRRESDEARAAIAAGQPVRLTHLVELPPFAADAPFRREITPAVSEGARRFAPDLPLAALAPLLSARAGGGFDAPAPAPVGAAPDARGRVALPAPAPSAAAERATTSAAPPSVQAQAPRKRWPIVAAGGVVLLGAVWLLRPQPRTDRHEAPWLSNGAEQSAAAASSSAGDARAVPPATAAPAAAAGSPAPASAAAASAAPAGAASGAIAGAAAPASTAELASAAVASTGAAPAAGPAGDGYQRALGAGEALLKRGRYRAAASELKRAVQLNPESVPALLALGDAFLEADQPRSSLEPLERAARLDGRSGRAQLLLGTAYQSLSRNADAVRAYQRYLELEPAGEFAREVRSILANFSKIH